MPVKTNVSKKTSMDQLQGLLNCGLCASPLKNPVEANCGHVYCKSCMTKPPRKGSQSQGRAYSSRAATAASQFTCPACKEKISADGQNLRSREDVEIQMDALRNLVAAFKKDRESSSQYSHKNANGKAVDIVVSQRRDNEDPALKTIEKASKPSKKKLVTVDASKSKPTPKVNAKSKAASINGSPSSSLPSISARKLGKKRSQVSGSESDTEINSRKKSVASSRTSQSMDVAVVIDILEEDSLHTKHTQKEIVGSSVNNHAIANVSETEISDNDDPKPLDLSLSLTPLEKSSLPTKPRLAFKVESALALDLTTVKGIESRNVNSNSTVDTNSKDAPDHSNNFFHGQYPRRNLSYIKNPLSVFYSDPRQFDINLDRNSSSLRSTYNRNQNNNIIEKPNDPIAVNLNAHTKTKAVVSFDDNRTSSKNSPPKSKSVSQLSNHSKKSLNSNSARTNASEENTQEKADNALLAVCAENFEEMTCRGDALLLNCDLEFESQIQDFGCENTNPKHPLPTSNVDFEELPTNGKNNSDKKRSVEETGFLKDSGINVNVSKKLRMTPAQLSPAHPIASSPRKSNGIQKQKDTADAEESNNKASNGVIEDGGKENEFVDADDEWMVGDTDNDKGNCSDSDGSQELFFSTPKSQRNQSQSPSQNRGLPPSLLALERTRKALTPKRNSPKAPSKKLDLFNSRKASGQTPNYGKNNNNDKNMNVVSPFRDFDPFDDEFDAEDFSEIEHSSNVGSVRVSSVRAIGSDLETYTRQAEIVKNSVTPVRNKTALVWDDKRSPGIRPNSALGGLLSPATSRQRQLTPRSKRKADFQTPTKSLDVFNRDSRSSNIVGNYNKSNTNVNNLSQSLSQGKMSSVFNPHRPNISNSDFFTPSKLSSAPLNSPFKSHTPGKTAMMGTPSVGRKNFVFCPTRLSKYQLLKLNQLCGMCVGKISKEYSDEVSHLILTLENNRVPQTMKYLFAIASKKWVVVFDWVEECLRQNKIVSEELFETSSFKGCDEGVRKSRLAEVPLFQGFSFHVLGNLKSSGASVEDWQRLLQKLGANVIEDGNLVTRDVLIVGDSSDLSKNYQSWFDDYQVITVAWEWILDCVLSYSLIPLVKDHYIITKLESAQQLMEIGLPKALLP